MLFPIIRVNDNGYEHIVGTNTHDYLYIKNNAIHFEDIQCCESTEYPESGITFVPEKVEEPEYDLRPYPSVEMMTLEEIIDLATEHMTAAVNDKIEMYRMVKELSKKKIEDAQKETGITWDSSGVIF